MFHGYRIREGSGRVRDSFFQTLPELKPYSDNGLTVVRDSRDSFSI